MRWGLGRIGAGIDVDPAASAIVEECRMAWKLGQITLKTGTQGFSRMGNTVMSVE